jgi:hypothetical protein
LRHCPRCGQVDTYGTEKAGHLRGTLVLGVALGVTGRFRRAGCGTKWARWRTAARWLLEEWAVRATIGSRVAVADFGEEASGVTLSSGGRVVVAGIRRLRAVAP